MNRKSEVIMSRQVSTPPRIRPRAEFAAILKNRELYGHGDPQDVADRLNCWFDRLVLQSGVDVSPPLMMAVWVCSAVSVGGLAFVLQENLLATAFGLLTGLLIAVVTVLVIRARRQTLLAEQLLPAIDELSRAARTGRSLEGCLKLVATDTPAPLGPEIGYVARKMELGLSVSDALEDLPLRTGLDNIDMLTHALSVHGQTGSDLVSVLDRLSRALRDQPY